MSYIRTFSKDIQVYYSGSVHTSVSNGNGGSTSVTVPYSGTVTERVYVNVNVDTNPFEDSIGRCNNNVNLLTGAVAATEAAQVQSIRNNANKVGNTIINGFFKLVGSDLSQQITELTSKIDSLILHLRELSKNCVGKQKQMDVDYHRLTERYCKIFNDLDKELENRIFEISKPAFQFKRVCDKNASRSLGTDMVGTVAVGGCENSALEAKIVASLAKKRAFDTISKANTFLVKQKMTENILKKSILEEGEATQHYAPVCMIETVGKDELVNRTVYKCERFPEINDNCVIDKFDSVSWQNPDPESMHEIQMNFNKVVSSAYASSDAHGERVRECMNELFNKNEIKTF